MPILSSGHSRRKERAGIRRSFCGQGGVSKHQGYILARPLHGFPEGLVPQAGGTSFGRGTEGNLISTPPWRLEIL